MFWLILIMTKLLNISFCAIIFFFAIFLHAQLPVDHGPEQAEEIVNGLPTEQTVSKHVKPNITLKTKVDPKVMQEALHVLDKHRDHVQEFPTWIALLVTGYLLVASFFMQFVICKFGVCSCNKRNCVNC